MRGAQDEPLAAGTVVDGRYRVIAELGAGGMGRVYEAEHMFIRRPMALKLLRGGGGPEAAARMVQEATLAGQVPHAAVVRVFDCAALADGQVYVAMELLRGESLEQALARGIDAAAALAVLAEVGRGLAAVHRVGVVHRDIKPGNIFLARTSEGVQAKLLDFGVAKALPGASELAAGAVRTQAGEVLGTPYYVAPEQVRGGAIDGRADLYSVGVMLYEALTGELPFVGDNYVAILGQHARVVPVDPRQAAPERGIPDAAARLAMRLLEKDPAARLADGDDLAEAIGEVLRDEGEVLARLATGRRVSAGAGVDAGTVQVGEVAGRATMPVGDAEAVASHATLRVADVVSSATVRVAEPIAGRATVRVAEASPATMPAEANAGGAGVQAGAANARGAASASAAMRAEVREAEAGASAGRMAEGTGAGEGRGTWMLGGIAAAIGVAAVVWFAGREQAVVAEVVAPPAEVQPEPVKALAVEIGAGPAEATPAASQGPQEPAPAPEVKAEPVKREPATARPGGTSGSNKGTKKPRDGGTTRPASKTPAKVGDDPPLKPDVYGND